VSAPTATNYLLQHAAGSGKSYTIAALAAALLDTVSELTTHTAAAWIVDCPVLCVQTCFIQ
jgi:predicted GTPase